MRGRVAEDSTILPGASEPDGEGLSWAIFEALQGKTVTTLVGSRQFTVVGVASDLIRLRVQQTKRMKYVGKTQLQRTLAELKENGSLALQNVRTYAPDTSSYVAALLVAVPGVKWDEGSQRLVLDPPVGGRSRPIAAKTPARHPPALAGEVSFQATWIQQGKEVLWSWRKLAPDVQRQIAALAMAEAAFLVREVELCESVPEQLLASRLLSEVRSVSFVEDFELHPQYRIETRDGTVRVDFLVKGSFGGTPVSLVIECDGHAYHNKTKEQVARDRKRERSLRVAGYQTARFTASEISADPEDCALEVFRQMLAVAGPAEGDKDSARPAESP